MKDEFISIILIAVIAVLAVFGEDAQAKQKTKDTRVPVVYYDQLGEYKCGGGSEFMTFDIYKHGSVTTYLNGIHRIDKVVIELRK